MPAKASVRRKARKDSSSNKDIVIDKKRGLVFSSEAELFAHFKPQIDALEAEFSENVKDDDVAEERYDEYQELLQSTLDEPDEIWEDATTIHGQQVYTYVANYANDEEQVFYVALCHLTDGIPSFIFLHFPSHDLELVDRFRRGTLVFDRALKEVEQGAIEGDALSEGDELAMGLYKAMVKLRGERDIPETEFHNFTEMRDPTIDEPDEIWRSTDLSGNVLVTFIREFAEAGQDGVSYIVVTLEDTNSSSHSLLFSFPTNDESLVERYRHGENLQAEEVVQEASH